MGTDAWLRMCRSVNLQAPSVSGVDILAARALRRFVWYESGGAPVVSDTGKALVGRCESLGFLAGRYPRLIRSLCWVGSLSPSEGACAIRAHLFSDGDSRAACEAVAHYCRGGDVAPLLERAWKRRAAARAYFGKLTL